MSLRVFFIVLVALVLLFALTSFYFYINQGLQESSLEVRKLEETALRDALSAKVRAKQFELRTYARALENNHRFTRAFILAKSAESRRQLEEKIRKELSLENVRIIETTNASGFSLEPLANDIILSFSSPLRWQGAVIATLNLGVRLDFGSIRHVRLDSHPSESAMSIPVEDLGVPGQLTFVPDFQNSQRISKAAIHKVLQTGAILFVFWLINIALFVEIGWVRPMREFVFRLRDATSELSNGRVPQIEIPAQRFIEIETLREVILGLNRNLVQYAEELDVKSRTEAIGRIAAQVEHDIRSPLSALRAELNLKAPDGQRMQLCVDRLKSIVDGLSERRSSPHEVTQLVSSVQRIIDEKSPRYPMTLEIRRTFEGVGKQRVVTERIEFERVFSNLVDNAIEASRELMHEILVELDHVDAKFIVRIQDRGRGIPQGLLHRVGERGFSFGKPQGSGLGLWYAKKCLEEWGGSLTLFSIENEGTLVVFEMPLLEST